MSCLENLCRRDFRCSRRTQAADGVLCSAADFGGWSSVRALGTSTRCVFRQRLGLTLSMLLILRRLVESERDFLTGSPPLVTATPIHGPPVGVEAVCGGLDPDYTLRVEGEPESYWILRRRA